MIMEPPKWLQDYREGKSVDGPSFSRDHQSVTSTPLLRDVAFNRHSMNDGHHVSPYDNNKIQIGVDCVIVKLVQGIDVLALQRTLSMATRATIGIDISKPMPGEWEFCAELKAYWESGNHDGLKIRADWPKLGCGHATHRQQYMFPNQDKYEGQVPGADWEEMLRGGLQTALETAVVVFAVQGVSRTCTHQLVRSRRASFHQQSQRASFMGDDPEVRMPESIWNHSDPMVRRLYNEAAEAAHLAYRVACQADVSYQDARYILPEGTTNYILCEYTLREFINVFAYRGCSMFSWEIVHVMREMRRLLVEAYPWLEPHIKISCEKTSGAKDGDSIEAANQAHRDGYDAHTCTFQGWEKVEGQCDFPWARDSNRAFRSEAHEIGGRKQLGVEVIDSAPKGDPFQDMQIHWARAGRLQHVGFTDTVSTSMKDVTCEKCLWIIRLEVLDWDEGLHYEPMAAPHANPKMVDYFGLSHVYSGLNPREIRAATADPSAVTCRSCREFLELEGLL